MCHCASGCSCRHQVCVLDFVVELELPLQLLSVSVVMLSPLIICTCNGDFQNSFHLRRLPFVQGSDIIFYGDSIIGAWRGTSCGVSCAPTCTGDPELFQSYFGNSSSLILGVAGETQSSMCSFMMFMNMLLVTRLWPMVPTHNVIFALPMHQQEPAAAGPGLESFQLQACNVILESMVMHASFYAQEIRWLTCSGDCRTVSFYRSISPELLSY